MISGAQVRAARSLLGWTAAELATKAGVGISTVQRVENAQDAPNARGGNLAAIEHALETAGIEFLNHGQPGVRLVEPRAKRK
jgi:transcriptional regulator with XRE-family HTH domain